MTKEELEKATGQELIEERNYCGVDGYYTGLLNNVNEEMLSRFNRLAELEQKVIRLRNLGLENINKYEQWHLTDRRTIAELEKENAELKADNDARKFAMAMSEKVEKQLREQIEKMKCPWNCRKFGNCKLSNCPCDKWEIQK